MDQNTQVISAAAAGTVQVGDRKVNRLGYGAMRITGKGILGTACGSRCGTSNTAARRRA